MTINSSDLQTPVLWLNTQLIPLEEKLDTFIRTYETLVANLTTKFPPEDTANLAFKTINFEDYQSEQNENKKASLIALAQEQLKKLLELAAKQKKGFEKEIQDIQLALTQAKLTKKEITSLYSIQEFFSTNENFFVNMGIFHEILTGCNALENLYRQEEQECLTTYLQNMAALLKAHQGLNFFSPISDNTTPPATVIKKMNEMINSDDFTCYFEIIMKLVLAQDSLDMIYKNHIVPMRRTLAKSSHTLTHYTPMPMQCATRYPLLFTPILNKMLEINKEQLASLYTKQDIDLASRSLVTLEKLVENLNRLKGNQESAQLAKVEIDKIDTLAEKKVYALRAILRLSLNTHIQESTIKTTYFDGYLKRLLAEAYPDLFTLKDELFSVKQTTHDTLIYEAFGASTPPINLIKFNHEKLKRLFILNGNPLWLVLKSTMPIDERFAAVDKIKACVEVAQAILDKKIGLHDKKEIALVMKHTADAIAHIYPEYNQLVKNTFSPSPSSSPSSSPLASRKKKDPQTGDQLFGNNIFRKLSRDELLEEFIKAEERYADGIAKAVERSNHAVEKNQALLTEQHDQSIEINELTSALRAAHTEINTLESQLTEKSHQPLRDDETEALKKVLAAQQEQHEAITKALESARTRVNQLKTLLTKAQIKLPHTPKPGENPVFLFNTTPSSQSNTAPPQIPQVPHRKNSTS